MIKYIDLLKNMEKFHEIDGVVMTKTERYNNNFNFYIETSKGWLFNIEKRENGVKCYAENKEKGRHFALNVDSVDYLLNTINDYLNPPKENKTQKNDEMDLLLKRLRNDTTEHLEKMKKTDDYDERVLETMGIIIDCLVDYVGNTEEIREIIGKRLDEAFE
jgi:hypothetical protein